MKKIIRLTAALLIAALALAGCGPLVSDDERELSVYASFYPIYALTEALTRDVPRMSVHCLVQPQDQCLRAYALSDWDAALLRTSADAVLLGGRGLESFESTLFSWGSDGPAVSAVLYNLELYNRSTSHAQAEGESHLEGQNPHLYMSIDGARDLLVSLSAALETLDPRYAETYAANAAAASEALDALKMQTTELLEGCSGRKVALMNEALIYVARDYGLDVVAWIDRESGVDLYDAEMEECLDVLAASGAEAVLIERQAPIALVDALKAAGFPVARIDILSTHREGEGFDAYVQAQRENAEAIRRALDHADQKTGGQP